MNLIKSILFILGVSWILIQCSSFSTSTYIVEKREINQHKMIWVKSIRMEPSEYLPQFEKMVVSAFRYSFLTHEKQVKFEYERPVTVNETFNNRLATNSLTSSPKKISSPLFLSKYLEDDKPTKPKKIPSKSLTNLKPSLTMKKESKTKTTPSSKRLLTDIFLIYNLKNDLSQISPLYSLTIGMVVYTKSKGIIAEGRTTLSEVDFIDFKLMQKMTDSLIGEIFEKISGE